MISSMLSKKFKQKFFLVRAGMFFFINFIPTIKYICYRHIFVNSLLGDINRKLVDEKLLDRKSTFNIRSVIMHRKILFNLKNCYETLFSKNALTNA